MANKKSNQKIKKKNISKVQSRNNEPQKATSQAIALKFTKWTAIAISLLLVITLISYWPALNNQWTNLDDDKYVLDNPKITSLDAKHLNVILTKPHDGNFHPLTMLSLAIDYQIGEFQPKAYHVTNIILHLLDTLLVFWILLLLGNQFFNKNTNLFALFGGLLFGLATIHVESVAWISERKDVLYALFYFASILSYLYYLKENKSKYIVIALVFFVLSILSKGMAVALSLSIVAIDYLYGRNLFSKKVILEKIPFFALSFIFGLIAIWAQKSKGYMQAENVYEFGERMIYAAYALSNYIGKLFYPYNLSPIYPYPKDLGLAVIPKYFLWFIIPAITVIASIFYFWKKNRHIVFSILFFIANLIFVLQFIPVGGVIMSDRYTYIASFGFIYFLAYGFIYLWEKFPKGKIALGIFTIAYLGLTGFLTQEQTKIWKNSFSLWERVLGLYPHTPSAWYNQAVAYYDIQDYPNAIKSYSEAIKVAPNYLDAIYNRGNTKFYNNDIEGAIADYTLCIAQSPQHSKSLFNRSIAYIKIRNFAAAEKDCNAVIQMTPNYIDALFNRGIARINLQKNQEAINDFTQILQLNSTSYNALLYRGIAKIRSGKKAEGCAEIKQTVDLNIAEAQENFDKYCK